MIGVSFDKPLAPAAERAKAVEPFIKQHGLTYPILLGDASIWSNYIQKPGFSSPFVVFIDRKGWVVGQYEEGDDHKVHDSDFLENEVKLLLKR